MLKYFVLFFLFSSFLFSGGCPGCGGYAGSGGTEAGLLGLLGSLMGNAGNNFYFSYYFGKFEDHKLDGIIYALQIPLNRWITIQGAIPYSSSDGTKIMYLDEPFHYESEGMGDFGLMLWFDLPGIKKIAPCPMDGDMTKVADFLHINFGLGATFPTGKYSFSDEWGLYPSEYQRGTGTVDYIGSFSIFKRIKKVQPQFSFLYKKSGGRNPVDWWRSDSFYIKANLIYLTNPIKKGGFDIGLALSSVLENDRNYGWGPPGMYMEIYDSKGNFGTGYISYGMEIVKKLRAGVSYSFPVYQKKGKDVDKFKNIIGINFNINF